MTRTKPKCHINRPSQAFTSELEKSVNAEVRVIVWRKMGAPSAFPELQDKVMDKGVFDIVAACKRHQGL